MKNLEEHLIEKKPAILKKWFDDIADSYAQDTAGFLKKQKAQFTNPVGFTLSEGIEGLFDGLLKGLIREDVFQFLDSIVRIRAIQEFSPSEAVSFIVHLKKVIRQELGKEVLQQQGIADELTTFESSIDDLVLFSFDIYVKCREKIFEIKANEARSMTFRLLQQAKLIVDNQD